MVRQKRFLSSIVVNAGEVEPGEMVRIFLTVDTLLTIAKEISDMNAPISATAPWSISRFAPSTPV